MRIPLRLFAIISGLFFAVAAHAAPISFLHETLDASGTLDGQVFGTSEVRIRATGDTANVQSFGSGWFIDHATASVEILGVGTFDFITPTRTFVNNNQQIVGFSRAGQSGADLLNGPTDAVFGAWDMLSSIGPINGDLGYLQWTNSDVVTSGGVLVFNNSTVSGSFTARVGDAPPVPLPAAGWLMIAALGGLGAMRARRKK